jgi:intracellular multiplication protein IcmC
MAAACEGNPIVCSIARQVDIITNLAKTVAPLERLITASTYLLGIIFVFKGIHTLKVYGEGRTQMSGSTSIKEPLVYFLVGAALLYFPTTFDILMKTTFDYTNVLQYAPIDSPNQALNSLFGGSSSVGRPLTMLIQVIGLIAFVRGWILIARGASQGQPPGNTGKGLMHVFGGILAVNIVGTLNVLNKTLYG